MCTLPNESKLCICFSATGLSIIYLLQYNRAWRKQDWKNANISKDHSYIPQEQVMCNKQTNPNKCKNWFTVPLFLVKHLRGSHTEPSIVLSHSQIQPKGSWKSIKISSSIKSLLYTNKKNRPEEKIMNTLPKGKQTSSPSVTCWHLAAGLKSTLP